jgi:uncharacterized protein YkwD
MTSRFVPLALVLAALACTSAEDDPPAVPTDVEYCAEVVEWDSEGSDFELEVFERVNLYREAGAMCGVMEFEPAEPLVMDESLRCAARVHALDMATKDYVSHSTPDGFDFISRAGDAGYDEGPVGENIATGLITPQDVVSAWMGRDGDCINIMRPETREFGIGYLATDEATFGTYWVAVFGEPAAE